MAPRRRTPPAPSVVKLDLGHDIELRWVKPTDLREQDINAQVMAPAEFARLVANVKARGALESIPYAAQPPGQKHTEIVSGHHRVRAAVEAELDGFWVMVDTSPLTRSQVTAKQIAHNQLVGRSDEAILRQLLERIDNVDDLLETGLPEEFLPTVESPNVTLGTPAADFDWRTISFTFLPHQLEEFTALVEQLDGQEVVGAAPLELFEPFVKALAAYQRERQILSIGTAIALLTNTALAALQPVPPADAD